MGKRLNAVVVGCGAIGPVHMNAIIKAESANLYGVCDIDKMRVESFAREYNCKGYTLFEDVLNDKNVDSLHICTPHYLHLPMIKEAAEAGKRLVVEKPFALDYDSAFEAVNMLEKRGIETCAILQNRLNNCIVKMKEIINGGKYGKLLGAKAFLTWMRTPKYYESADWRGRWDTEGGGLIINQAVHLLDLLYYLGGEVESIKGTIDTRVLGDTIEVEDTAEATLYYKNGGVAHFFATNAYSMNSPFFIELHLENGILRYSDNKLYKVIDNGLRQIASDLKSNNKEKCYWGSSHEKAISDFYAVLCKESLGGYIAARDSLPSMALVSALYESSRNGKRVTKGDGTILSTRIYK